MPSDPSTLAIERPKQARSKARRKLLIDYGMELFNTRDLDEVSITEITRGVGFSTGSFYSYFADKAELFVAVQTQVAAQQDAMVAEVFSPDAITTLPLHARLQRCVDFALRYFRCHTGLVRSALRYERRIPQGWQPNRTTTAQIIGRACHGLDPAAQTRLETAIQLAFGLLVNALLHDPGPLRLEDPDLTDKIVAALSPYLNT